MFWASFLCVLPTSSVLLLPFPVPRWYWPTHRFVLAAEAGGLGAVEARHPSTAKPVPGAQFVVTPNNVHIMPCFLFCFSRQVKEPFVLSNTNSPFVTRMDICSFSPRDKALLHDLLSWAGSYRRPCYSKIWCKGSGFFTLLFLKIVFKQALLWGTLFDHL